MDSYDEIPYESLPFHETHPEFLATRARLFGIATAEPQACRVLEIGCAAGGNLIPMACSLPGSRFLGIELSAAQAKEGAQRVAALGLDNIAIRQGDILAPPADLGEFDYIIAHGVYSWVPQAVRESLLGLCHDHLADKGVLYLSYNTLPGWRWRGMLRDMLLYHSRHAAGATARLAQAQRFLAELAPALAGQQGLTASYLREEIAHIAKNHPSYLFHEYLEENNDPFLFSDVIDACRRHALDYIADAELASMFPFSMDEHAAELVARHEDPIAMWQEMDFLSGRTFRQSLLCRGARHLDYDIDLDAFSDFALYADLVPQKRPELRRRRPLAFRCADGRTFTAEHPLTQAALLHLGEHYPDAIGFEALSHIARERVMQAGNAPAAGEAMALQNELFLLYTQQAVQARTTPARFHKTVSERPRAAPLALAQGAAGMTTIAVAHHGMMRLDPFSARLLSALDGEHTLVQLVDEMSAAMRHDPALCSLLDEPRRDPQKQRPLIHGNCQRLLSLFARNGLLVA